MTDTSSTTPVEPIFKTSTTSTTIIIANADDIGRVYAPDSWTGFLRIDLDYSVPADLFIEREAARALAHHILEELDR